MIVPKDKSYEKAVYHTFIIQTEDRDELKEHLARKGVDTKVHYPIPIHYQEAAKELGYKKGDFPVTEKQAETILSIPIYPELTDDQVGYIIGEIRNFYN
jgi:dTDP-4-amino-4,6-dideoxygalactose transaminase